MKTPDNMTHRPRAIDPARFRAQATGIGQSRAMSEMSGARRAMEVVEHMPEHCRAAVPAAEGYPMTEAYEGRAEDWGNADPSDRGMLTHTQRGY